MVVHLNHWTGLVKEHRVIGLVLFLGLINGLVFLYTVPPWQHYDEPTHFEYAWLIANSPRFPENGDYNQSMRREVAASMLEHGFFRDLDFQPNLLSSNEPIWIGISQLGSSPAYYWLTALPLRLLRFTDVSSQLIAARYVSLFLFLVTILAAYGISIELAPSGHPLRWLLPAAIVLLPGFVDIMTALNDDVGATAMFSLYLWVGIRLINRGFNWARFIIFLVLAGLCFLTKNTVLIALVLTVFPVFFSIVKSSRLRVAWIVGGIGFGLLLFSMLAWGDAAFWHRLTSLELPTSTKSSEAPLGDHVFQIGISPQTQASTLIQLVPDSRLKNLGERYVSLGAWIWASESSNVRTPILVTDSEKFFKEIEVNTRPTFYSFSIKLKPNVSRLMVELSPSQKTSEEYVSIFYDGIVLAEGKQPKKKVPNFNDITASQGTWGNRQFTNIIRNGSAELTWPWLRPWVDRILGNFFPGIPSREFSLLLDPLPVKWYHQETLKSFTQSFWARFGWGNVTLPGNYLYIILGFITLAGLIGAIFALWQRRKQISWAIVIFLSLALLFIWGSAFLRGIGTILETAHFIPGARYAYPVIIPTMLVLILGWIVITQWLSKYLKLPSKSILLILLLFLVVLNVLSIYSIVRHYAG